MYIAKYSNNCCRQLRQGDAQTQMTTIFAAVATKVSTFVVLIVADGGGLSEALFRHVTTWLSQFCRALYIKSFRRNLP